MNTSTRLPDVEQQETFAGLNEAVASQAQAELATDEAIRLINGVQLTIFDELGVDGLGAEVRKTLTNALDGLSRSAAVLRGGVA